MYCLPETDQAQAFWRARGAAEPKPHALPGWLPKTEILSFEEIERVTRLFADLGIEKVRLTGGEPLLRQGVERLVARLAAIPGIKDLAMTSNGFLFPLKAKALRAAGLRRVSFSLDSLDPANFKRITGREGLSEVLASIALARDLGLEPVKVNAVIIRGLNDHELETLAQFAQERALSLRFIEFMPLDSAQAWSRELVVTGQEMLARLQARFALEPLAPDHPAATAKRWAFRGGRGGEVGLIASVSEPFCGHCNRVRLTADGQVRTCLFSAREHDLKRWLRGGASDHELACCLRDIAGQKEAGHQIGAPDFVPPERTMSCIGG